MCWVKIAIPNNRTLSLNYELKISIFSAQDPLYDTVCCMNNSCILRILLTQIMTLTVQDCLEIWRISKPDCCCFLCIQARSSIAYGSLWTFTNSLFIKHCISNK